MLLQDLKRRVEAIERELATRGRPGLARHNADKTERSARLHEAVRQLLGMSSEPYRLTAKQVRKQLDLQTIGWPDVAVRTVRDHMRSIRGSTPVPP
jgi:hypothetical protein